MVYRGPRPESKTEADPELGEEQDELLSPHPHPHFSQRAPWLRAGVLGVRFSRHFAALRRFAQLTSADMSSSGRSMHAVHAISPDVLTALPCAWSQASDGLVSVASLMLGAPLAHVLSCEVETVVPKPSVPARIATSCDRTETL